MVRRIARPSRPHRPNQSTWSPDIKQGGPVYRNPDAGIFVRKSPLLFSDEGRARCLMHVMNENSECIGLLRPIYIKRY